MFFHVMAAVSEFERDLIRERTQAGLKAARARGRLGGRPPAIPAEKMATARTLILSELPVAEVCDSLNISNKTFYRYRRRFLAEAANP